MKIKKVMPVFLTLVLYILFFTNAKYINKSIVNSIDFCLKTLVPSVFPFMVLSCFLINSGLCDELISHCGFLTKNKLGICKTYLSSVILGSVSGFVTGPKCICSLYSKSDGKDEASFSDSVILSSNCGVGFVISCVGILIWDSIGFGIFLYASQIAVALLLGKFMLKRGKSEGYFAPRAEANFTDSFTSSVISSASSVVNISAFVVFFSLLTDTLTLLLPEGISRFLPIIFEFSRGSFHAMEFDAMGLRAFLSGFAVGFGGLSVTFQTFSVCSGYPLNKKKYIIFKLFHGLILGAMATLYAYINNI